MTKKINLIKLSGILESDRFDPSIQNTNVLTNGEKTLLAFLVDLMGDVESALITKKLLAGQTGYCKMSIFRFVKKLVLFGYIKRERTRAGLKIAWGPKKLR